MERTDFSEPEGCCFTCGYLSLFTGGAIWDPTRVPRYGEAEPRLRQLDFTSNTYGPGYPLGMQTLACFRSVFDIDGTIREWASNPDAARDQTETAWQVLITRRECPQWTEYIPRLSPREHLDRQQMLDLQRQAQEFQQHIADQSALTQVQIANTADRQMRISLITVALIVLATLLAPIISARVTPRPAAPVINQTILPSTVVVQPAIVSPTVTATP